MPRESNANFGSSFGLLEAVRTLIFPKLSLVYGQRLSLMYEGLSDNAVMADWATGLEGISLEGIGWALKNLPPTDFPPNVQQFRRLCAERPAPRQFPPVLNMDEPCEVPTFVQDVSRRIRESENSVEPQQIRHARRYLARVATNGRRMTHTEREWVKHYLQLVQGYERPGVLQPQEFSA